MLGLLFILLVPPATNGRSTGGLRLPFPAVVPVAKVIYDGEVAPGMLRLRCRNPFHTWWWVREGKAKVEWRGGGSRLGPEDWIFFPSSWERTHEIDPGTRLVSVGFELVWPHGGAVLCMDGPLRGSGDAGLRRLGVAAARAHADPESGFREALPQRRLEFPEWLEARARLALLAAELCRRALAAGAGLGAREPQDSRLQRVLADLSAECRAGPLPYARWSRICGLGRGQLDRLARQHLGSSLRAWRDQLLEREVRGRLAEGSETLKEIAAALGFVDAAHFNHWVRRRLGDSPSRLRRDGV